MDKKHPVTIGIFRYDVIPTVIASPGNKVHHWVPELKRTLCNRYAPKSYSNGRPTTCKDCLKYGEVVTSIAMNFYPRS